MRWLLVLLMGCGEEGDGMFPSSSGDVVLSEDYDGLIADSSWTYRDLQNGEGDTGGLDEDALLQARYLGDGIVEFRQGSRWADAVVVGSLEWKSRAGLNLASWDFGGNIQGKGTFPLTDETPEAGESVSQDGWSCETLKPELYDTWYGSFEDVYSFECSGAGPSGVYVFARDIGLIALQMDAGLEFDLVAPW